MMSPGSKRHPKSNFQILCLVVLVISLTQDSSAVVNRGTNIRNYVANFGNDVNNNANPENKIDNTENIVANTEKHVANTDTNVTNIQNNAANTESNVSFTETNAANTESNVSFTETNAANTTLDEMQTYVEASSKMATYEDENNFQNKTTVDRGGRGEKEGREGKDKEGRGRREGRLERGKYLKNNVTEVNYILDRSESVKREGIFPYHYHSPHHEEYEADDYHHHHQIQDGGHHHQAINFPHHHSYPQVHHHSHHHDPPYDVAVKAALGPLVGVALLGVVASLIANPVLLQLGVVGAGKRRRRRRHTAHPALDLSVITGLLSQVPKSSYLLSQERGMIDNYMKCSGLLNSIQDGCVLRLACELWSENSKLFQSQRNVVRRTLSEIMASEMIPYHIRDMIYKASEHGKLLGHCDQYHCKRFEGNRIENEEKFERN